MMRVQDKRVCNAKREILMLASAVLMLCACGDKVKEYDATGTFEATETTVFAEQSGALQFFNVNEGDNIVLGQEIGLVDTTQIWLKIKQLGATKQVYQSQKPD
ncbi:MAG: HlyD family secretion protein, partial [Prevotella sp.]|nr:HlyD family secretion protein [Prevotella sp.]